MAITTLTGLGSGLDIKNLVPALIEAERAPKQAQIKSQMLRNETQLSAVGMLKSALEAFETSLLSLKSSSKSFDGYKAASSKEAVANVTLQPVAAKASKVASAPLVDGHDTSFASGGTLSISMGGKTHDISIAAGATLAEVTTAVNTQLGSQGITAGIEFEAGEVRLALLSKQTGAGNDISVSGTGDLAQLNVDGSVEMTASSAGYITRAANAINVTQGSYVLKVDSLASASKVASAVQPDGVSTRYASGGELTIKVGGGTPYKITVAANATLDQIRDSINSQLSAVGVSASIISDSSGARLVLSSELTGAGNDISLTSTGADLATLDIDGTQQQAGSGAGWLTQAKDAKYFIDGLEMSSKGNTITGLQGLSIKLLEEGTTTLSVSTNADGIAASVESFVMAYNTLLTVTNGLTKVTQTTDKDGNPTTQAGALVADSTLRSMMSQLRSAFANPVQGAGDLKLLTQLGVKTSRTTGMLELDSDQLKKAVAENPAAIKDFFTGKQGMFERIGNITSVYSGKGGLLASREASLTKNTERLGLDQANLDRRIEKLTLTLFAKFNAMDSLVARLNATSQSVMATLNALNKKKDD
ncbi:MAG TPA: flagellar filament capping protein FliD [Pseudomonas sp.]|uniref:flagellar filament capping protein FliD n=1 Tax=Pseudomonas sp. TaxID=306 RepID=UPI002CD0E7AF|nr:flagellar filament capping protein FliD [Pseudomonas sp.]HTO18357.1 flagellar filament capping protein FliD [Pseudomonas sp.]